MTRLEMFGVESLGCVCEGGVGTGILVRWMS